MSFAAPIAEQIWDQKYRLKEADGTPIDRDIHDTWSRIATALAEAEKPEERGDWAAKFYDALKDFKYIPAGRIVAGAGSGRNVTLQNCYVLGTIPDSMGGIFDALKDAALTMQMGGGIGHDFSTLRPKGAPVKGVAADASGPLSFMDVWDDMCRTIMSAGSRRGAMMGTMRCDHPDIEAFIEAKRDAAKLRMFNLSVLVTDAFMEAAKADSEWPLQFNGRVYRTIRARDLWDKIMRSTYDYAEPGVIFIDRINAMNPLNYCERIAATNPCGEEPLPPYGACLLGSINLSRFVTDPFTTKAKINRKALKEIVHVAVRMMDNVNDVTKYPLPQQETESKNKRRIGLGVTGLADMLIMLGVTYGSDEAVRLTDEVMCLIARHSYLASAELAKEKGPFLLFDKEAYLAHPYVQRFDKEVIDAIATYGLRNSHLTSIAPTGTISLMAGNVSSGIEPVFAYTYNRKVLNPDGSKREEAVEDYAYRAWLDHMKGELDLPHYFVSAQTLSPEAHVKMQAAAQKWVDSSISKTVNVPEDISFEDFKAVYQMAYDTGCKGCTTYRPNDVTGSVLSVDEPKKIEEKPAEVIAASAPALTLQERPEVVSGQTYKLKWPGEEHALYITINDIERNGRMEPFELFFNTKNPEHRAWSDALSRMISAVFRRGGDTSFVAQELKEVFDPRGGSWLKGKFVPSTLAAIGDIIQRHTSEGRQVKQEGSLQVPVGGWEQHLNRLNREVRDTTGVTFTMIVPKGDTPLVGEVGSMPIGTKMCPKCSSFNTKNESGCFQCLDCGESKCG